MKFSLRQLFINSSKILGGNLGVHAVSFLQGVLIARAFGPANYGIWGIVLAYCGTVKAVLSFRTSEPLTKYLVEFQSQEDQEAIQQLLRVGLLVEIATSVAALVFIILVAPFMAGMLNLEGDAIKAAWIFAVSQVFAFITPVYYSVVRNEKRFNQIALLPLFMAALQTISIYALQFTGNLDLISLAVAHLATGFIHFLANTAVLRRYTLQRFGFEIFTLELTSLWDGRSRLSGFWGFMKTTYVASTVSALLKTGDTLLLGYFSQPTQVGLYRLAKTLVSLVNSTATSLSSVVYQDFSELVSQDRHKTLLETMKKLMRFWVPMVVTGFVVAILSSGHVIPLVFGEAYDGSAPLFNILLAGISVSIALFWIQPLALSLGFHALYLRVVMSVSLIALALMIFMSNSFGALGMAIAYSSSWAAVHLVLLISVKARMGW